MAEAIKANTHKIKINTSMQGGYMEAGKTHKHTYIQDTDQRTVIKVGQANTLMEQERKEDDSCAGGEQRAGKKDNGRQKILRKRQGKTKENIKTRREDKILTNRAEKEEKPRNK